MIYYKKKSLIKKFINKIQRKTQGEKPRVFSFFKGVFILFILCLIGLYSTYLFLIPKVIDENNTKKIIENYFLKETDLNFETKNLTIKPDYKFNIAIKADYIKLNHPNNYDLILIENPNIHINLFALFYGYIDLNQINSKKITIKTAFTKSNKYSCFKYLKQDAKTKFKLKNINFSTDNLTLNIYDENILKSFILDSSKLKISNYNLKKLLNISTNGKIYTQEHKITDFDLKLAIKLNQSSTNNFKEKLINLNQNPLRYANEYKFYSKSDIDLKINTQNKKAPCEGYISLNNYSFSIKDIKLPKNNLILKFKNNKIYSDCNFNLIKNQSIKINLIANTTKNKFIEATLNSNKINLSEFGEILNTVCKIFNLKINLDEIILSGEANADIYLKSDFKTITSKGYLLIENSKINHKKTGLIIKDINSNINFANNMINITNTSAYINDSKFNFSGTVDKNTNLNLKIYSEAINIAQVITFIKEFPLTKSFMPFLNNYSFKEGLLKINSTINGTIKNPIIKSNSYLDNLYLIYSKNKTSAKIEKIKFILNPQDNTLKNGLISLNNAIFICNNKTTTIPKMDLKIANNDILIPKTNLIFEKIPLIIEGVLKNYKDKNNELNLKINGNIPKDNDLFAIKKEVLKLNSTINLKQNKLALNADFSDDSKIIANLNGYINDISNIPILNLKLQINEKTSTIISKDLNLDIIGNLEIIGNVEKPNISGKLNLSNIYLNDYNLNIEQALVDIKNSKAYLNVSKGNIFDFDFDLIAQGNYLNKTLNVDFANMNIAFIDLDSFEKYLKTKNNLSDTYKYQINNLKTYISSIQTQNVVFNSINLEGEIKDNVFNIMNFSADCLNGKINGSANINLLNRKVKTKLNLEELNIRQLSSKLKELSIATSGKLSAIIDGEFDGFNMDEILNTFSGNIKFKINNGELSQFAKLERFLQAGNILSQSISKLTLNSTLSALTKQNTGDFKVIEGEIEVEKTNAIIKHIISQGSNMSLYIKGEFNILSKYIKTQILGRIPNSIVNVMGNLGNFSFSKLDKTQENNTKNSETKFSTIISAQDLMKIPNLAYTQSLENTREFMVHIDGILSNLSSIKDFKWNSR